jgi:dynein light chain LC8-type
MAERKAVIKNADVSVFCFPLISILLEVSVFLQHHSIVLTLKYLVFYLYFLAYHLQMSEDMQQDAVDCASQALEKYNIEKDIAAYIKKEFDKKYNPTWHCIVGRNFGSYVTHETKHFIYFYLGQVAILLFKSG